MDQDQSKEEMHRAGSVKVTNMILLLFLECIEPPVTDL